MPYDNRDDASVVQIVPLHSPFQLSQVEPVRRHVVGGHEDDDDVGLVEPLCPLALLVGPRGGDADVPDSDVAMEGLQMLL